MAPLQSYDINAMATNISREFYIQENHVDDKSYVLMDEMRLFAMDMKSRVTFISRVKRQWDINDGYSKEIFYYTKPST